MPTLVAAAATEPDLKLAQFHHAVWTSKDGIPGQVYSIAQSPDGYLWLGTAGGLVRFDGVSFEVVQTLGGVTIGTPLVLSVVAEPDGGMWIGTGGSGAGQLKDGRYTAYGAESGVTVATDAVTDLDGTTWLVANGRLVRNSGGRLLTIDASWGYPSAPTRNLLVDREGTLWTTLITSNALYYLPRGAARFKTLGSLEAVHPEKVAQAPDGSIWTSGQLGIFSVSMSGGVPQEVRKLSGTPTGLITFDTEGGLWAYRANVLQHVSRPASMTHVDGDARLAAETQRTEEVRAIFQDREGNIWVATSGGLERYRRTKLAPIKLPRRPVGFAIAPADHGSIWATNVDGNLMRVSQDAIEDVALAGQSQSIFRDTSGSLWVGGLNKLWKSNAAGQFVPVDMPEPPLTDRIRAMTQDPSGALWVASGEASSVVKLENGVWSWPAGRDGFPDRWGSRAMFTDSHGRVWIGYADEILLVVGGQAQRLTKQGHGMELGSVTSFFERGDHMWVGGTLGVALFDGKLFRALKDTDGKPLGAVSGIVETSDGDLWLHQVNGAVRIPAAEVARSAPTFDAGLKVEHFDESDGLYGSAGPGNPRPSLIQSSDGLLWFATNGGVAWVDPTNVRRHSMAPNVLVVGVRADGRAFDPKEALDLPALNRRLEISYTATNLGVPEHIRFRYKLGGVDVDWHEAGTRRVAYYNDLKPGKYEFQVSSTNEEGAWSGEAVSIPFRIAPAWFQTIWFRLLCALALLVSTWLLYRIRVGHVTRQVRLQLRGQQTERERIARELHDTLLQGIHGLIWRFQALSEQIPRNDRVREEMDTALELADKVLIEGRERVSDIREGGDGQTSLSEALRTISAALEDGHAAEFFLRVKGNERMLYPMIQQEVCSLVREALLNAFRHAQARTISLDIEYGRSELSVRLVDDGVGLEADVLRQGRPGHWGLSGMRERAEAIGALLNIESQPGQGTTIQLRLRAGRAYAGRLVKLASLET